jgi:uncharacterized repeat protein (TIGR01451 family)/LPXTG-motif cell wall-anchored protein
MGPGATGTCTFVARVQPAPDGGPHRNVATVHGVELRPIGSEGDDIEASDDATVTFAATPGTDLAVTKDDGQDTVRPGEETTYSITVANRGDTEVTGVALVDTLPEGTTFVSATGRAALADGSGDAARDGAAAVVWPWFGLAPGEERTVEVTLEVGDRALDVNEVRNRVVVHDDGAHGPDVNPDDNAAVDVNDVSARPVAPPADDPRPDPGISGSLPRTGGAVAEWALWGGLLLAAGVALRGLARKAPRWRVRT